MRLVLSSLFIVVLSFSYAQQFNGSVTVGYGCLNEKVRLQYEHPLNDQLSIGGNINYYLVNWKGPIVEPFFRFYGKSGNEEGYFGQVKIGYGNLTTLYTEEEASYVLNKRMNSFGGGVGLGHKYLFDDRFVVESYFGFRYYTYSPTRYSDEYYNTSIATTIESVGWFLTTGLPIELNFKIGYQF